MRYERIKAPRNKERKTCPRLPVMIVFRSAFHYHSAKRETPSHTKAITKRAKIISSQLRNGIMRHAITRRRCISYEAYYIIGHTLHYRSEIFQRAFHYRPVKTRNALPYKSNYEARQNHIITAAKRNHATQLRGDAASHTKRTILSVTHCIIALEYILDL
jgi:hypothetical protein